MPFTADIMKAMLNPVRMRIIQHLILHPTATSGEIAAALSDVPKATLYRHIKKLAQLELLQVAEERPVRGSVERVYRLAPNPQWHGSEEELEQMHQGLFAILLGIMGDFERYFAQQPPPDPAKGDIALTTSTLMLTDGEMRQLSVEMGKILGPLVQNGPAPGRKARKLTFIITPAEASAAPPEGREKEEPPC
ncbi:helix-turn-helix domain-containing protein [Bittarella sp. HCP28S3_D9]|uniref:helix-turn-helix domain-containing protein n=1 Tax=Bittarella sp. HCP28S3_D9 TaxID=3440253 RepID=UPI003F8959AD